MKNPFGRKLEQPAAADNNVALLRMMEQRMLAVQIAGEGIGIAEPDGTISFVNESFAAMYGYESWRDMVGMKWTDLAAPEERDALSEDIDRHLQVAKKWSGTCTSRRRNGEIFYKAMTISGLPDGRWIFIARDISDHVALEDTARRRLAAIEAAGDGIGMVDAQGRLTYMNRALKDLHDFRDGDERDYIGHDWTRLYTERGRDDVNNVVLPALAQDGYWKGESSILTRTGRVVQAELSLTRLEDGGLIGTARDISDQIKARAAHEKLERQFYQAQKMEAVGRLAGGIAHDFNNILAAMMGYAEFLMEDLPPGSKQYQFAQSIHRGGAQARDIVGRLLMFSRSYDHAVVPVDLAQAVRQTMDLFRSGLPATVEMDFIPPEGECRVDGDPSLIAQVLMNLLVNARDAVDNRHGHITVSIGRDVFDLGRNSNMALSGRMDEGRDYIVVSVRDDGCGMNRILLDHIFDPFFTTKPVDRGTGLGLATVHGIMQSHRGAVGVSSVEGCGSEFRLYFPTPRDDSVPAPDGGATETAGSIHPGLRVLLVEDQAEVRCMLGTMLHRAGARVQVCGDGLAALDFLRHAIDPFDLVITDQTMPGMTGNELAGVIAESWPDLPVILISGYAEENLSKMIGADSPIRGILHKPVEREKLMKMVAEAVEPKP